HSLLKRVLMTTAALYSRWIAVILALIRVLELASSSALAADEAKVFRAGAAAVDVSPRKLPVIVNGNMTEVLANEIVDRLHARALVLDDDASRIAIVIVDSCAMPRDLLDEAKRLARKACGIPIDRMLIAATHTHSAPSVLPALGSDVDVDYAKFLP